MITATTERTDEIHPDRRRHARVVARGVASHLQTMDASMAGLAVENLSVAGMFVRSATALAVGTRVMVQLVRPGLKKAIPSLGSVVSVVPPAEAHRLGTVAGMGIRLDPELDASRRLGDLVNELAAMPARSPSAEIEAPPTRLSTPPPPPAAVDTSASDWAVRDRLVRQLEEEVVALRRELLRRNRTIGDLANRLAAYEGAGEAARVARRPVRVDPRAE
jgi:PilZ domain